MDIPKTVQEMEYLGFVVNTREMTNISPRSKDKGNPEGCGQHDYCGNDTAEETCPLHWDNSGVLHFQAENLPSSDSILPDHCAVVTRNRRQGWDITSRTTTPHKYRRVLPCNRIRCFEARMGSSLSGQEAEWHINVLDLRFSSLTAWPISGKSTLCKVFQAGLQTSFCSTGKATPMLHITQPGLSGVTGIAEGRVIPFLDHWLHISDFCDACNISSCSLFIAFKEHQMEASFLFKYLALKCCEWRELKSNITS